MASGPIATTDHGSKLLSLNCGHEPYSFAEVAFLNHKVAALNSAEEIREWFTNPLDNSLTPINVYHVGNGSHREARIVFENIKSAAYWVAHGIHFGKTGIQEVEFADRIYNARNDSSRP
jgi:hypothetical protein